MEKELKKDLLLKIKSNELLKGQDLKDAIEYWNYIRSTHGLVSKTNDCCGSEQRQMKKTILNFLTEQKTVISPEELKPINIEEKVKRDIKISTKIFDKETIVTGLKNAKVPTTDVKFENPYDLMDRKFLYDLAIERELQIFKTIGKTKLIELHEKYDKINSNTIN